MEAPFVMALDQGTTSSRAVLFDRLGRVAAAGQVPLPLTFPHPGWVEVDGEALWASQWQATLQCVQAARRALPGFDVGQIRAIGIANQRETTMIWDRATGRLLAPAIIWQCRRSVGIAEAWRERGLESMIRERTGLNLDPYFSASKLGWLFQTYPDLRPQAEAGALAFGTVDTFLVHRLSGMKTHVTDVSNASRTALFNIQTLAWDEDLLRAMDLSPTLLPDVVDSAGLLAMTDPAWFGRAIPICAMVGDQQAALFGQRCHQPNMAKCTVGTGAFVLAHAGSAPSPTPKALIRTIAWRMGGEPVVYALEGAVFTAGALITWLKDGLKVIESAADTEQMARSVPDTGGVVLVPAFSGLGTPYWDPGARGLLIGMTSLTSRSHLVRAALESIAFQVVDVLQAMASASGASLDVLCVDGGVMNNGWVAQFMANISGVAIERPPMTEATARGAAWLAGLAAEVWPSVADLPRFDPTTIDRFEPNLAEDQRQKQYRQWQRAVARARGWVETETERVN